MKKILKALGYLVGILLMTAGLITIVLYMMGMITDKGESNIVTSMTPVESSTPAPDGTVIQNDTQQNGTNSVTAGTPTPIITPSPTPTAEPSPSPTPTPEPTPTPAPAGIAVGTGSFSSDTGIWIDLVATWDAKTLDNDNVEITVVCDLKSYSLQLGESNKALKITVGDQTATLTVPAINTDTKEEVVNQIGTATFTVNAPNGQITLVPLEATWSFGGVYSGKQLDEITCGGDMQISR